ncbi:hypothetical protein [Xenorhabdus koppenhoeferi]|uniref:hypothetical protein n=1 Tax=Xenorhabdus koppenhoeferi TaxID=351659 RepID=UPI0015A59B09|nr:hypothetical protein [Xenorhabdus koppenhoeferi]
MDKFPGIPWRVSFSIKIDININYPASLFRQWQEQTWKKPLTHTFVIGPFSLSYSA